MKRLVLYVILVLFTIPLSGQIGVHVKHINTKANHWNKILSLDLSSEQKAFANGMEYGIDWWLRLKKYRIEWTPEIAYGKTETFFVTSSGNQRHYKMEMASLHLNNNIYIFDLKEPDCPRYGLQGDVFKKGFFLHLSPGITRFEQFFRIEGIQHETKTTAVKLGIGAGMDFILWNLISITPYVRMNLYPIVKWDQLRETHAEGATNITTGSSPINQLQLGVRIGLRPKILRD